MLKEKFKEVGRLNNEIYKEDLLNIKDTILGISGSYFTKKIFENIYQYQDHSIGMSKKMLEMKVIRFKNMVEKFNIQIIIVFENLLSVRLNQRNSILKKTLTLHNVQFINTPYSEHAQLIYYFKNNLISGIVSDLDIIKYFSETNNYVIIDFNVEAEQFEWIHLSKFLASMNLTHHYARQLLLQEQSQRKIQKDVIEQFDSIQKQKNFDRDSSVNHPSYKDQIFRIEYVPIINLSCNLQFYKQTIETPSMEDRMKKHFGQILPSTLYQFFVFDLISSDIFNIFGYQRFKYVPNIYDSKELKVLIAQTCQHYSKIISLIKMYLPEMNSKSEIFNIISENEEYSKEGLAQNSTSKEQQQQLLQQYPPSAAHNQPTQTIFNYEFIYSDLIIEPLFSFLSAQTTQSGNTVNPQQFSQAFPNAFKQNLNNQMPEKCSNNFIQQNFVSQTQFSTTTTTIGQQQSRHSQNAFNLQQNQNNNYNESNTQNEFSLIRILQKFLEILRKNSKNSSRKNSESIKGQQNNGGEQGRQRQRLQQQQQGDNQDLGSNQLNSEYSLDCQKLASLLQNQQNIQNQQDQKGNPQYSESDEAIRNTPQKSIGQNQPSITSIKQLSTLQIYSLAALNFFNLQELIVLSKQQITQIAKYLCKCSSDFSEQLIIFSNIIQNENLCGIFFSNLFFDPEEANQKEQSLQTNQSTQFTQNQSTSNGIAQDQNIRSTDQQAVNGKQSGSDANNPQKNNIGSPPTPLLASQQSLGVNTINNPVSQISITSKSTNPKELIQRKLIDEKLPIEEKLLILVLSRIFSLSELSFKEWKNDEYYDFELTQYIKIIQSVQSILRNQFDCLLLCSYCYINNNSNMQSVLESKKFMPFRTNYNCGMGMLIILLLSGRLKLEDIFKDDDNFPFIRQELKQAFLLWENIFSFVKQQQSDKYPDPSILKIYQILSSSNEYLLKKIDRKIVFAE